MEAMNKDDKEAKMFASLQDKTNSIEEVTSYDVNNNEARNRSQEERTVEEI